MKYQIMPFTFQVISLLLQQAQTVTEKTYKQQTISYYIGVLRHPV